MILMCLDIDRETLIEPFQKKIEYSTSKTEALQKDSLSKYNVSIPKIKQNFKLGPQTVRNRNNDPNSHAKVKRSFKDSMIIQQEYEQGKLGEKEKRNLSQRELLTLLRVVEGDLRKSRIIHSKYKAEIADHQKGNFQLTITII